MTNIEEKFQELSSNGFNCGIPLGVETVLPEGGSFLAYLNTTNKLTTTIYNQPGIGAVEVHGAILAYYVLQGGPLGNLGYPLSDEKDWNTDNGQLVGRMNLFERGIIYWRQKNGMIYKQAIDNKNMIYWGIDSVASYKDIVSDVKGKLSNITGNIPCFKGVYLPRDASNTNNINSIASSIHDVFLFSNSLSRVLLIDNAHAVEGVNTLIGFDNGKNHALSACKRCESLISAYSILMNRVGLQLPPSIVIFGDIEPNTSFDKDYIEGWIDGFNQYNNGVPIVSFKPGLYISFHPSRANNSKIIDQVNNPNLLLWAQHPNEPDLIESNVFTRGYKPFSPSTHKCDLWQFNNFDNRFKTGANYWIDHDLAKASSYNLFWAGDQNIYLL